MNYIDTAIKKSKAYYCLDCGKCTANCPIAHYDETFSPRKIIDQVILQNPAQILQNGTIYQCLTCQMCSERCPSGVTFSNFIIDIRKEAFKTGNLPQCSHGGMLHTIMQMMTRPHLKQNRTGWIPKKAKTAEKGDILYFVGCLPYYNNIFSKDFGIKPTDIAVSTLKILNHLGIEPVIMKNERCCGTDLLSMGDMENFTKLAEINIKMIKDTGVKKIVTACAECYHTLKEIYPEISRDFNLEVLHISQFISENLSSFQLKKKKNLKVTYQDPCKLGRYNGVYDDPRKIISSIPGVELVEMKKSRSSAQCCGTSSWISCDTVSKKLQVNRLTQAVSSGGKLLVTACPKCQIHFNCAMSEETLDESARIDIKDLTVLFASALSS